MKTHKVDSKYCMEYLGSLDATKGFECALVSLKDRCDYIRGYIQAGGRISSVRTTYPKLNNDGRIA